MLTLAERYIDEGEAKGMVKGMAKGMALGADKMLKLIKSGLSPEEALRKIKEDNID